MKIFIYFFIYFVLLSIIIGSLSLGTWILIKYIQYTRSSSSEGNFWNNEIWETMKENWVIFLSYGITIIFLVFIFLLLLAFIFMEPLLRHILNMRCQEFTKLYDKEVKLKEKNKLYAERIRVIRANVDKRRDKLKTEREEAEEKKKINLFVDNEISIRKIILKQQEKIKEIEEIKTEIEKKYFTENNDFYRKSTRLAGLHPQGEQQYYTETDPITRQLIIDRFFQTERDIPVDQAGRYSVDGPYDQ